MGVGCTNGYRVHDCSMSPASRVPTYQIANGTATIEAALYRATWGARLAVHCTQSKQKMVGKAPKKNQGNAQKKI